MNQLPVVGGTAAVVVIVIVGLFRWLVQNDLSLLRQQVTEQSARIAHLEVLYDEQRTDKHRAITDLASTLIALQLVRRLAQECTCKVLAPLEEIIDKLVDEVRSRRNPPRYIPEEETL